MASSGVKQKALLALILHHGYCLVDAASLGDQLRRRGGGSAGRRGGRNRLGLSVIRILDRFELMVVVDCVGKFLPGLAESGSWSRSMFLARRNRGCIAETDLAHELPGEVSIGFILIANDRRLTDISNFQSDHTIAIEPYKLDFVRRLPIDPFLEWSLAVHFPNLLVRGSNRFQNHLPIHTNQHFMI